MKINSKHLYTVLIVLLKRVIRLNVITFHKTKFMALMEGIYQDKKLFYKNHIRIRTGIDYVLVCGTKLRKFEANAW